MLITPTEIQALEEMHSTNVEKYVGQATDKGIIDALAYCTWVGSNGADFSEKPVFGGKGILYAIIADKKYPVGELKLMPDVQKDLFGEAVHKDVLLRDKFMEPPFSILNTMGGDWQNRKRNWKSLGIKSEIGRDDNKDVQVLKNGFGASYGRTGATSSDGSGTSVFDPALCELMYHWFCPEGGRIFDPFAGGSVRGIVANYLGFKYTGVDIRQEQVDSNREQALEILEANNQPNWYVADSKEFLTSGLHSFTNPLYDMVFTCPPYLDLEVYSELPGDLSNMPVLKFEEHYQDIISGCFKILHQDGYAVIVVGDVRDKKGNYRAFPEMTTRCFLKAGFKLYNKAILQQPLGTAMLRASRVFEAGKKLIKVHEDILIFKKQ